MSATPAPEKKRRQHHVWQHYLKPWSVAGRIWVSQGDRVFATGTTVVAVERDFYKLHNLSNDDVALLRTLLGDPSHPLIKKLDNDLFFRLMAPVQFVQQNRGRIKNIRQVEAYLDVHMTNALEDYHAAIEARFIPILNLLRTGDLNLLDDMDVSIDFFHFVGTQYMRTTRVKERSIKIVREKNGADLSRIWPVLSIICGRDVGASLFIERKRRKFVLVQNVTNVPFVTGDQPAINLSGEKPEPTEQFSLYYSYYTAACSVAARGRQRTGFLDRDTHRRAGDPIKRKYLSCCAPPGLC
jgi:hypothetical protein